MGEPLEMNVSKPNLLTDLSFTDPRFLSTSDILGTDPELELPVPPALPFFFLLYNKHDSKVKYSPTSMW